MTTIPITFNLKFSHSTKIKILTLNKTQKKKPWLNLTSPSGGKRLIILLKIRTLLKIICESKILFNPTTLYLILMRE
jgi:hypothetical protein